MSEHFAKQIFTEHEKFLEIGKGACVWVSHASETACISGFSHASRFMFQCTAECVEGIGGDDPPNWAKKCFARNPFSVFGHLWNRSRIISDASEDKCVTMSVYPCVRA